MTGSWIAPKADRGTLWWMARILTCTGVVLWGVVVVGPGAAQATSSGLVANTLGAALLASDGLIELSIPRGDEDRLHALEIESGKSTSIRTSYSVKRVSVGNPDILGVVVLGGREIQLVAKEIGATNLIVWDASGRPQAVIDVHVGTAYTQVERSLRSTFDNESLSVTGAGHAVVLKGNVPNALVLDQTVKLARAMLGQKADAEIVNLLEVGGNQQVMLEVIVAEVSRSLKREFGTNFAALIETGSGTVAIGSFVGGIATPIGASTFASSAANLLASFAGFGGLEVLEVFLDLLDERGLSKILAKPTLVARSGETASFLVGGEVPIPIAQGGAFGSITIEFHDFGVGLAFTPTVLGPNRIHLRVNPEVSRADFAFGTETDGTRVPGFLTRRASTSVELADGQSFMIAGLLSDQVREIAAKYPILGDIPILGSLFRSTAFLKEETELVIIVTPRLVKPMGTGTIPLPTDSFIEPTDIEFYLLGALEGKAPKTNGQIETGGMIGGIGHRVSTSFDVGSTE